MTTIECIFFNKHEHMPVKIYFHTFFLIFTNIFVLLNPTKDKKYVRYVI